MKYFEAYEKRRKAEFPKGSLWMWEGAYTLNSVVYVHNHVIKEHGIAYVNYGYKYHPRKHMRKPQFYISKEKFQRIAISFVPPPELAQATTTAPTHPVE